MSLYQYLLVFYAVMAAIAFVITWFLSHEKKHIRFLSRLPGGGDLADEFSSGAAVFAVLNLEH
ncbi:GhoT/OrtT family toxin [Escherichia sp. E3659]|uniref:GhoT/OrtT family toxin n=1 Tax=Escherichia sp. E3659 TaxID=2044462 RepID=UPI0023EF5180|nr:GhoT/OrtT family toxin [Escherichia sp. E3659]